MITFFKLIIGELNQLILFNLIFFFFNLSIKMLRLRYTSNSFIRNLQKSLQINRKKWIRFTSQQSFNRVSQYNELMEELLLRGDSQGIIKLHSEMRTKGLKPDDTSILYLLNAYKNQDPKEGAKVALSFFESEHIKNTAICNALILLLIRDHKYFYAMKIYNYMVRNKIRRTQETFSNLLYSETLHGFDKNKYIRKISRLFNMDLMLGSPFTRERFEMAHMLFLAKYYYVIGYQDFKIYTLLLMTKNNEVKKVIAVLNLMPSLFPKDYVNELIFRVIHYYISKREYNNAFLVLEAIGKNAIPQSVKDLLFEYGKSSEDVKDMLNFLTIEPTIKKT